MTLALTAGSMFAGQITQTVTFGPANTDESDAQTFATFQKFQSASGYVAGDILNSVTLEIVINQTITALSIKNTDSNADTFTFKTLATYGVCADGTLTCSAPSADTAALGNAISSIYQIFSTGSTSIGPGVTQGFIPPASASKNTDTGVITAASISPYNTTGNFTIGYDTTTSESITGGGGNIVATQSSTTAATYTVIYNYTIPQTGSPEPATMTLFGSALLGIGFFARKRFVKK